MSTYLDGALGVAEFLDSQRHDDGERAAWNRASGQSPVHTLYHGTAGVALFYLELHRATGDESYLATATAAGQSLLAYVDATIADAKALTVGLYSGWPGYVFVLNELAKATDDQRFREAAKAAHDRMVSQASELGAGLGWIEDLPFSDITGVKGKGEVVDMSIGAAGAGVLELYAHREGLTDSLALATGVGDRLLEIAEPVDGGLRWLMMAEMPFPFTAPNFAHGPAGTAYFLADLFAATGEKRFLDAAIGGADYVMAKTSPQSEGFLVCHNEEEQPAETFYLGVCHGPPGTGRLMYRLYELTKDERYLNWLEANVAGLIATGAPEKRSSGLWQNYGQCCGDAGIGDYAIFLYGVTKNDAYLTYAKRIADYVLAHADTGVGLSWSTAEHRARPGFVESQTGYMQGAAGIGSFLLHLATATSGSPSKIVLPETPFTVAG